MVNLCPTGEAELAPAQEVQIALTQTVGVVVVVREGQEVAAEGAVEEGRATTDSLSLSTPNRNATFLVFTVGEGEGFYF